ncbi:serine hydrolase domain-containing protein [Mucilaginibacter sp. dw_454]|uniref:serine hydrolase domain-containing protein n=1 Tax=Mucilaginibacter sp. dw_454 TaxID=2720079 RepID=UPI0031FEDB6F
MKKRALPLLLAFALTISHTIAQQIKRPDGKTMPVTAINRIVKKLIDTADVTGLQLGIINNNVTTFVNSYGYKNSATRQLNTPVTSLYAASLAKPLFGYLVMQLVDEGKINLDKPLYQYLTKPLPQYDNYKDLTGDNRWKLITARMCLSHTTGFPNWRELRPDHQLKILFTPGTHYNYSGEGIQLLQLVVETITGKPLEILAREKVFKPLNMMHTDFVWQPRFENNYAVGHDWNGDTLTKIKYTKAAAAGSMETTITDYTRFVAAVMQGQGLSSKSKRDIFSPQIIIKSKHQSDEADSSINNNNQTTQLSYGLGWGLFTTPYGKAFFKEGSLDGWGHYVIGFPDKKIAIVIMCNSNGGESMFKELVEKLTGVTIPWYWENYIPYRQNVKLPASVLQQYTGEYNGKIKAILSVVNGRLKIESPTVNLGKTNLYAQNDHHFFLKIMDLDVDFVKDTNGKVIKAVFDDEGEHYELIKTK